MHTETNLLQDSERCPQQAVPTEFPKNAVGEEVGDEVSDHAKEELLQSYSDKEKSLLAGQW